MHPKHLRLFPAPPRLGHRLARHDARADHKICADLFLRHVHQMQNIVMPVKQHQHRPIIDTIPRHR